MAFWNRKARQTRKAAVEQRKQAIKTEEVFNAVSARAPNDVLLWIKDAINLAFRELAHRQLVLQAIRALDGSEEWSGVAEAIESEMRRIQAPPAPPEEQPEAENAEPEGKAA